MSIFTFLHSVNTHKKSTIIPEGILNILFRSHVLVTIAQEHRFRLPQIPCVKKVKKNFLNVLVGTSERWLQLNGQNCATGLDPVAAFSAFQLGTRVLFSQCISKGCLTVRHRLLGLSHMCATHWYLRPKDIQDKL